MRIYLIGLPGVGKSTIGKIISKILNLEFHDTDKLIELEENMTPKEIIEKFGESHFRNVETEILGLTDELEGVIACGGGIVERKENKRLFHGVVVYLKVDPKDLIFSKDDINSRPLLKESGIEKLYEKRAAKYLDFADYVVDVTSKSNDEVADEVIKYYENISY
ncbi:MAG TPA: shikimate kinase [Acholeplasmataceae bacterium]|jgi:shikimate kinase|nr:shikimate kinase [Acholeplasmataceae bacterium]